jgi:hypothetical protein
VGYIFVAIVWVLRSWLLFRPQQKAKEILQSFDTDKERISALKSLLGVEPPSALRSHDILEWTRIYAKERTKIIYLIAFISTLITVVLITGMAIYKSFNEIENDKPPVLIEERFIKKDSK